MSQSKGRVGSVKNLLRVAFLCRGIVLKSQFISPTVPYTFPHV
jgi:hypothetical protein